MSRFRRVEADRAGASALGVLIPPGKRTVIILRPRSLAWDLLPARWSGDPQRPPEFCQLARDDAPAVARKLIEALEDAAARQVNPLETFGKAGAYQIWLRTPEPLPEGGVVSMLDVKVTATVASTKMRMFTMMSRNGTILSSPPSSSGASSRGWLSRRILPRCAAVSESDIAVGATQPGRCPMVKRLKVRSMVASRSCWMALARVCRMICAIMQNTAMPSPSAVLYMASAMPFDSRRCLSA